MLICLGVESSGLLDNALGFILAKIYAVLGLEEELERIRLALDLSVLDSNLLQAIVLNSRNELGELYNFKKCSYFLT